MPQERVPSPLLPRDYVPPSGVPYRVQDGDTWESIAAAHLLQKAYNLVEYNFQTLSMAEVNYYLRHYVGCQQISEDGHRWTFSGDANPGIIYLPPLLRIESAGNGDYVLREGECFEEAAYSNGFAPRKLWNHSGNTELRRVRQQEALVRRGDRIDFPRLELGQESCATGRRHKFARLGTRRGVLEVHLELDPCESAQNGDRFRLTGRGGSEPYEAWRTPKEDADARDHGITLRFGGLPVDGHYTLQVILKDGSEVLLFENVPYEQLNRPSDDLAPQSVNPALPQPL